MRKALLLAVIGLLFVGAPAVAQAPLLEPAGVEDLGGGTYRYHYLVNHAVDPYVNTDITDVHVEGHYQWQPGTVSVEGPGGWVGEYDGTFYHWRLTGSGSPVVGGSIESGFSITLIDITTELVLVDSPVQWTEDPYDDQSVFASSETLMPVGGPRFEYLGHDDLGGGQLRHHYAVNHTTNPWVDEEITDVHVDGRFQWKPGLVTVEGPTGWEAVYDGRFYHWRVQDTGQPIVYGSVEAGFTISTTSILVDPVLVTHVPVRFTNDPHADDSVFAETLTSVPRPDPWGTCHAPHQSWNRRSLGAIVTVHVVPQPPYTATDIAGQALELWVEWAGPLTEVSRDLVSEQTLSVSFDRADAYALAPVGEAIEITVSGLMSDGLEFEAGGHVRVFEEGGLHVFDDDPSTILDHAIRGDAEHLGVLGDGDLGPVICMPWYLSNYDFTLNTDPQTPLEGQAFFYLYQFCEGTPTCSYGQSSTGFERTPSSGDCP